MALDIKIGIINYDDKIVITDDTGDYNAVSNPSGWNDTTTPNTLSYRSNVTAVNLDIYLPSTTTSIGISDLFSTTFFATSDRAYDLFNDPVSVPGVVPTFTLQDGIWKYVINFVGANPQSTPIYSLRVNDLVCSIGKLALGDMDSNNFEEIKLLYDKMLQAFNCEDYVLAQSLYEDIQFSLTDCGSSYSYSSCGC
jgi:hypothetical protein